MFKVGQKVVCIDDSPGWNLGVTGLVKDKIYTVSEIHMIGIGHLGLVEWVQGYWAQSRFRPVDDTWADEVLTNICKELKRELQPI